MRLARPRSDRKDLRTGAGSVERHSMNRREVRRGSLLAAWIAVASARSMGAQDATLPASPPESAGPSIPSVLGAEARRYLSDGKDLVLSPLRWDETSWIEAASTIGSLAALSSQDARIDSAFQRNRSHATNTVSRAVTPLGSYAGVGLSAGWLGAGLLWRDSRLTETGRDAIEAELFAAGIVTPILKQAFGRLRPVQGSDGDEFRPLSSRQSFPSGHATEAFAVASVFATRAEGWIVPTIAYALAGSVALARMNDRAHFASDVAAGAVIGTAVGRSVVRRHTGERGKETAWRFVPVTSPRGGIGIGIGLDSGR